MSKFIGLQILDEAIQVSKLTNLTKNSFLDSLVNSRRVRQTRYSKLLSVNGVRLPRKPSARTTIFAD